MEVVLSPTEYESFDLERNCDSPDQLIRWLFSKIILTSSSDTSLRLKDGELSLRGFQFVNGPYEEPSLFREEFSPSIAQSILFGLTSLSGLVSEDSTGCAGNWNLVTPEGNYAIRWMIVRDLPDKWQIDFRLLNLSPQ